MAAIAFLTSPIGIIVVAIGALITIIVLLAKNWDSVKATAISAWDKISEKWKPVAEWFEKNVWTPFKKALTGLRKNGGKCGTEFKANLKQQLTG
mgnify:CR=1 FL=1